MRGRILLLMALAVGGIGSCSDSQTEPYADLPVIRLAPGDSAIAAIVHDTGPKISLQLTAGDTIDAGLFPDSTLHAWFVALDDSSSILEHGVNHESYLLPDQPDQILGFVVKTTGSYIVRIQGSPAQLGRGAPPWPSGNVIVRVRHSVPGLDFRYSDWIGSRR